MVFIPDRDYFIKQNAMFICNKCLKDGFYNSPSIFRSLGICELCELSCECSDIPSSHLRNRQKTNPVTGTNSAHSFTEGSEQTTQPGHTHGPWHWRVDDYSMATLSGPDELEDHVLSVTPCDSCIEYEKMHNPKNPQWKWGNCTTPSAADAELIRRAPELLEENGRLISVNTELARGVVVNSRLHDAAKEENEKLKREISANKERTEKLTAGLEDLQKQNDKLRIANNELAKGFTVSRRMQDGANENANKLRVELSELQKENDFMSTDSKHQEAAIHNLEEQNDNLQLTLRKMMSAMQKDVNRITQRANEFRIAVMKRNKRIFQYRTLFDKMVKDGRLSKKEHSEYIN